MYDGRDAIARLRLLPGGEHLLAVLADHPRARLVGGSVRDLLLGREPRELDVVVAGDARPVAAALGPITRDHRRFGTFTVTAGGLPIDVARARRERYARPGALPEVEPAGLDDDSRRRDFSINALTLTADGTVGGLPGALDDLAGRRLRVLHDVSFRDDPTRLWRLVRYSVRLGFLPEPRTDRLAHEAVAAGLLAAVSAERLTTELRLALREPDPLATLHAAQHLGLLSGLDIDPDRTARALALVPAGADRGLTVLGSCLQSPGWGTGFALRADERHVLDRCALLAPLPEVPPALPSDVLRLAGAEPDEAVAVAGARGSSGSAVQWFSTWRDQRPAIGGDDLLAAGVAAGPELGRILRATHCAVLDGRVAPGRESELAFALGDGGGPAAG